MKAIIENVSRRHFLVGVTGFVVAAQLLPTRAFAEMHEGYKTGADAMPHGVVTDPHVFVSIAKDGTVTIVAARAEMGTGAARTTLPLILADELEADWSRVKVAQGEGNEEKYGNQDTDGSRSVRHWIQPMRQMGASVRAMLTAAAAKHWGVAPGDVEAKNHEIVNKKTGQKIGYGDVADIAMAMPVPNRVALKTEDQFRYIGKGTIKPVDQMAIITGKAIYGIDAKVPGMKFAVIARPPVFGGKLVSYDDSEAKKVPGVEKIIVIEGTPAPAKFQPLGGVAVIAKNTWAAMQGRDALKIKWDDGPHASYDSDTFREQMKETASKPCLVVRNEGDAEKALASAAKVVTGEYYIPHISHAQMEPVTATAHYKRGPNGETLDVWAPVQSPGGTREEVAKRLKLKPEQVTLHETLLGGGFGRKSKCDYAIEAALLSKETGEPVKVIWTREDDIQHGYYHTVSYERIDAGLDQNGKVIAWRHRSVAPTILSIFAPDPKHEAPFELGMGLVDNPFDIPNLRCENGEAEAHTRIGWFRSVSNIPHGFAVQTMAAELAAATNRDPKEMLLDLIGPPRIVDPRKSVKDFWNYGDPFETYPIDTARLRGVVELAAEKANWGQKLPQGHGLGIAVHRSFQAYIATVVEAAVDAKGKVTVPRVWTAVDCGFVANPERLRSQIEGAAVMGYALARYGEITFKNGRPQQSNFDTYKVTRIDESPAQTEVHIVQHGLDVPSGGLGEPGVPPFAPALCNAIFAATGKRIRRLPIGDQLSA